MREARQAGHAPARTPTIAATIRQAISVPHGTANSRPSLERPCVTIQPKATPIDEAEQAADDRRDGALEADRAPQLAPRHADRAQHADLARALVDRQQERVDDAEQRDQHAHAEQRVDQEQQLVDLVADRLLELGVRLQLGGRELRREACRWRASRPPRGCCPALTVASTICTPLDVASGGAAARVVIMPPCSRVSSL